MSVGHLTRALEEAGTPTVIIMIDTFKHVGETMKLPRVLMTSNPLGRPMGAPGDRQTHAAVLEDALSLLESATEPTRVTRPDVFKPGEMD